MIKSDVHVKAAKTGRDGNILAVKWLEKRKFREISSHPTGLGAGFYDIDAYDKHGKHWLFEVKAGKTANIKFSNIRKMIRKTKIDRIGLIFIIDGEKFPILFELKKKSLDALRAWETIEKNREKNSKWPKML